jgi:hypothetical protein
MSPHTWADFDLDTTLERDMLARSLPLAPTRGTDHATITTRPPYSNVAVHLRTAGTLGPTPSGCIKLLAIRPLLFGTAWKVLDLLLETTLNLNGLKPTSGTEWRIFDKQAQARTNHHTTVPAGLSVQTWEAIVETYARTVDLRHALVHRTAWTDSSDALVGNDKQGRPLRPLSTVEQDAIGRTAMRAAESVINPDQRVLADLIRQLNQLHTLHQVQLPPSTSSDQVPTATVVVDPPCDGSIAYELPFTALARVRQSFPTATYIDLIVQFSDRPGLELRGRIEDAPNTPIFIDPFRPPAWLH